MVKINGKVLPFPYNLVAIPIVILTFLLIGAIFLTIALVFLSPVILLGLLIGGLL